MTKILKTYILTLIVSALLISTAYGTEASASEPVLKFFSGYRDLGEFHDGLAPVKNSSGKLGYIDLDGRLVIDYLFDTDRTDWGLDGDFSQVSNAHETVWIPMERMFDPRVNNSLPSATFNFDRGYAYVVKDGRNIFIDRDGNELLNPFPGKYYFVAPFFNGRAIAQETESGLFGYIDEAGNQVTPFKYLCASHYRTGMALAVEAIPFKNAGERFIPDYLASSVTNEEIDRVCPIRKANIPDGMDIIDVYLDTGGSVLSWSFHDKEKLDNNFRAGVIIDMEDVSEGLILRTDPDIAGTGPRFWYELADGSPAFYLDEALNITNAYPFTSEKIAEVLYSIGNESRTGYIDNTGRLLTDDEIRERFPNLLRNIEWQQPVMTGVSDSAEAGASHSKFYLVDGNFVAWDYTEQMSNGLAMIYSDYRGVSLIEAKEMIATGDSFLIGINIYKTDKSSNIYYVDIRKSIRELERVGYIVVEGW